GHTGEHSALIETSAPWFPKRQKVRPDLKLSKLLEPTESQFLAQVLALAKIRGWRTFHQRPGMTRKGRWCSAVQGDGVGFPDLVLCRGNRVCFAELKTDKGKQTIAQTAWEEALCKAEAEMYVWRPADWKQ